MTANCKNARSQHLILTIRILPVIVQQHYLIGVRRVRPKTQRAWLPSMPTRLLPAILYQKTVLKQKIKQDFAFNAKQTTFLRGIIMGNLDKTHSHLSVFRSVLVRPLTRTQKTKTATVRKERYTLKQLVKCQQHVPQANPLMLTKVRTRLAKTVVKKIVLKDVLMIVLPELQMFNIQLALFVGLAFQLLKLLNMVRTQLHKDFHLVQFLAAKITAKHLHTNV